MFGKLASAAAIATVLALSLGFASAPASADVASGKNGRIVAGDTRVPFVDCGRGVRVNCGQKPTGPIGDGNGPDQKCGIGGQFCKTTGGTTKKTTSGGKIGARPGEVVCGIVGPCKTRDGTDKKTTSGGTISPDRGEGRCGLAGAGMDGRCNTSKKANLLINSGQTNPLVGGKKFVN